jgi:proline iminopeptidase
MTAPAGRLLKLARSAVLLLIGAGAIYSAVAYVLYNRVHPAERACRDCETPVTVGGYQLLYREVGTDSTLAPVIVVHGGPGHSSLSFKRSFDFLAAHRRVIYYDQRGSGNSQSKARPADYVIDSLVEELEALRRDVVKADRIVLVGHSFGSALVQRYALRYGAHVEKLLLVGGIRLNNEMENRFVWRWFGPALYSTAMGLPRGDGDAADAWFTASADADNTERLYDKSRGALFEGTGTLSFAAWREISLSLVGDAHEGELRQLHVPTRFLYGAADAPYTGKPTAEALCAIIPNCKTVEFAHSGHWPFLEEPERFRQVVEAFLAEPR